MSVRQDRKRRSWYFVVDVAGDDGRRRQVKRRGFGTRKLAEEAERAFLHERDTGLPYVAPASLTVGGFLVDVWLPTLAGRGLRATTLDSYRRAVRTHLVPTLGTVRLQQLDTAHVERLLAVMAAAGRSPKTRRNVHGVLHSALVDAVRWGLVPRNAASGVRLPKVDKRPPRAWTADQVAAFLERVAGDRLAPLWNFVAMTGCRRGELLGLRWSDVDLTTGVVTMTNQRAIAGGSIAEGAPKTAAGARSIVLDDDTVAMLTAWRARQRLELVALGVRSDYVFTGESGGPLWPQRVTATFRALADELGLPRIGVHGLRHSNATELLASGENPKLVAQRLGHASPAITLAIYSHVLPAHDREAATRVASAFRRGRPSGRMSRTS